MDPDEQLCKLFLKNHFYDPQNPNIRIFHGSEEFNYYVNLCKEYGYEKEVSNLSKIMLPPRLANKTREVKETKIATTRPVGIPVISKPVNTNSSLTPNPARKNVLMEALERIEGKSTYLDYVKEKERIEGKSLNDLVVLNEKGNKIGTEFPVRLWDWEVKDNEPPIPIKYPVNRRYKENLIKEWRNKIGELSTMNEDLDNYNLIGLQRLFDLYNEHFFNNSLPKTTLEISNQLTRVAGKCKIPSDCKYTIRMSRPVFTKLNLLEGQGTKSGGVICTSRLNCLQLVLEHEIIHLIIGHTFPNRRGLDKRIYGSHGTLFKDLVKNYFGQTESTHQIGRIIHDVEQGRSLQPHEIVVGKIVSLLNKDILKKGVVVNILRKNAGVMFIDGDHWKVNFEFLHKVSEDDDDYDELLELQENILNGFKLYNTIKIGDAVEFYGDLKKKGEIYNGIVEKINKPSSKLSIKHSGGVYTITHPYLIRKLSNSISVIPNKSPPTTTSKIVKNVGEYTKNDFRVGDKVIVKGGPKTGPIYGTVIKIDRVNIQVQNSEGQIWRVNPSIMSFQ